METIRKRKERKRKSETEVDRDANLKSKKKRIRENEDGSIHELISKFHQKYLLVGASDMLWTGQWVSE